MYNPPQFETPRNINDPDEYRNAILRAISNFEKTLDANHEVALNLASFGQTITLEVTEVRSEWPLMIHFIGNLNGKSAHLIQHVSQLSFLIISIDKPDPQKETRRIGF
jgi:hypothetical protein